MSALPESDSAASPVLLPCGDSAILAELPTLNQVLALYRALSPVPEGVLDVVPAARTILVTFDPERLRMEAVRTWLLAARPIERAVSEGPLVTIEVCYDGPDLAEVAQYLAISEDELVELHTGSEWTAAFTGFAPGFAYLVTSHEKLRVPRRNTPRTSVPAGSVALAGEFSAIYPSSSPAGWQLIGHTSAQLWDAGQASAGLSGSARSRDERPGTSNSPALIVPGTRVRFTAL
ncbi:allophanate hydrolase subunit 1 [Psychromicrobium sp. YIM B11713]|uniref:5-oxoprolinase subunit B family protein n=1 Tax=Psychromicrobium sp. YIM B11713 TaxID=3145233 RepID=UPI00374EA068